MAHNCRSLHTTARSAHRGIADAWPWMSAYRRKTDLVRSRRAVWPRGRELV